MQKTPQTRQNLCLAQPLRCALLALMLLANTSHAADPAPATPAFSFSGFGTLGIARSSEKEADFIAHDLQSGGAGRDHEWSTDVDTRLGLQMRANLTSQLSAVVQVLAEQRYDGSYRPGFEWANISYEATPEFTLRAGRIVLPTFLTSDTRKVGYTQPWVRPPVELYSLMPITSSDGVDLTYRLRLGEVNHSLKAAYGGTDARVPDGGKVKVRDGWLLADTIEYGAATFHVAHARSKVTLEPFDELFSGYRNLANQAGQFATVLGGFGHPAASQYAGASAQAARIADQYEADSQRMDFIGIGASYDPGRWFVMAEWGQTDYNSIFGKRQAWYTTAGFRWRAFTPYVTYARARLKSRSSDPGTGMPAPLGPPFTATSAALAVGAAQLDAALNEGLSGAPEQKTYSIGIRWDFAKNAAFKLQYDHSDIGSGSPGTLDHATDRFRPGGRFDVWSATVDFVF